MRWPRWEYLGGDTQTGSYSRMTYHADQQLWIGREPLCRIGVDWQQPDLGCDAVRRWTAPYPGTIRIAGIVSKRAEQEVGDGAVATLFKNGIGVWGPQFIQGNEAAGHDFVTDIQAGDTLDFVVDVNRHQDDATRESVTAVGDDTRWDPFISYRIDAWSARDDFGGQVGQCHLHQPSGARRHPRGHILAAALQSP